MKPYFSFVQRTVSRIVDSGSKIPQWNMVEINDPYANHKISTSDVGQMKAAVQALTIGGSSTDFLEAYMKGR